MSFVKKNSPKSFDLPISADILLTIYNLADRKVDTLVHGNMESGHHSVAWNAGSQANGICFVKMIYGEKIYIQKLMLVK